MDLRLQNTTEFNGCINYVVDVDGKNDLSLPLSMIPNVTVDGIVQEDAYEYYQLCIARHSHEHQIEIHLHCLLGDANLYLSTTEPHPRMGASSWIAQRHGDEFIKLPTYLPEFSRNGAPLTLYIGTLSCIE